MTDLQRFENDGIELVINTRTGESFASQRGYARMAGKNQSTISRRLKLDASIQVVEAEIDTGYGVKVVALINEDTISDWIVDDNPVMAKKLLKVGVRGFLHKLAGFQITSTAVQPIDSTNQLLLRVLANQEEQAKYFNSQIAEMRLEMQQQNEKLMLLLPDHEMMNTIREAIDDLENIKPILEAISQSLKDNPCQPKHPLKYYLGNKQCGRGLRIRIGQMVSNWMSLSKGYKLGKLKGFQNRATLYPECALPLIILAWQICTA